LAEPHVITVYSAPRKSIAGLDAAFQLISRERLPITAGIPPKLSLAIRDCVEISF
jgi:hypothetical protein